jgi:tetratricopeptide (TPR) repeat protein
MISIGVSILLIGELVFGQTALDYAQRGATWQASGHFREAEAAYRNAIELFRAQRGQNHALAIVWRNIGAVLTAEGQLNKALDALKEALKLTSAKNFNDPALDAEVLNSLGVVYFRKGGMKEAETFFTQAAAIDSPSNNALAVALTNLGDLYQQSGRYKEAEKAYKRSLEVVKEKVLPDDSVMLPAMHGLAKTHIRSHNEALAEPILANAVDIAGRHTATREGVATAIEIMQTYSKLLRDLQKFAEAERVERDYRRLRASMIFTVQISPAN